MPYEFFCRSVRGASHIRKNTPCEDYGIKRDQGKFRVFAVADGHGDPNCLRSNVGSKFACEIAGEVLSEFGSELREIGKEELLFDEEKQGELLYWLKRSIVSRWIIAIDSELRENPLTEEELANAPKYGDEYSRGVRTERMYGTTLIAGLLTDRYLLLLQQGDGRCDVFDSEGRVSQPIPWDDRCVGTATTSMCDLDTIQSMRSLVIDLSSNPVIACIAGTDGVEDSFPTSMEKTHAYYREILREACEYGVAALEENLERDLSELSKAGSADDITVAGFVDIERTRPFLGDFEEANRAIDVQDELVVINDRLQSIQNGGMFAHLSRLYDDSMSLYETAKDKFDIVDAEFQELEDEIASDNEKISDDEDENIVIALIRRKILTSSILRDYEECSERRQAALEDLAKAEELKKSAEEQFIPRRDEYDELIAKREATLEKMREIEKDQGKNQ